MEIKAITEGLKWLGDSQHSKATFLTDSKSTLDKIETGSLYAGSVKNNPGHPNHQSLAMDILSRARWSQGK